MSVTTILSNGVPKPNLVHWAAVEVAKAALEAVPKLVRVRGEDARKRAFNDLRFAAERKRDAAADLGTAIHRRIESHVLSRVEDEPTEEERPFMDAFDLFVEQWKPEFVATELVVAHPEHGWARKTDFSAIIPKLGNRIPKAVDAKSGKRIYPEAALQLSAYKRATVGWLNNGEEVEPPECDEAYVLHIRPDKYKRRGGYALIPVKTGADVYEAFRDAQRVAHYTTKLSETLVGKPLVPPAATDAEVGS